MKLKELKENFKFGLSYGAGCAIGMYGLLHLGHKLYVKAKEADFITKSKEAFERVKEVYKDSK